MDRIGPDSRQSIRERLPWLALPRLCPLAERKYEWFRPGCLQLLPAIRRHAYRTSDCRWYRFDYIWGNVSLNYSALDHGLRFCARRGQLVPEITVVLI